MLRIRIVLGVESRGAIMIRFGVEPEDNPGANHLQLTPRTGPAEG